MSESVRRDLSRIRRAASWVELRLRLSRAVAAFGLSATAALVVAAAALAAHKVFPAQFPEARLRLAFGAAAVGLVVSVMASLLRKLPPLAGTQLLDLHHGLADRLTNAVQFAEVPDERRTKLMDAAVEDACAHAKELRPSGAAPIRVTGDLGVALLAAAGLVGVAVLEIRTPKPPPEVPKPKTIDAISLPQDDLDLFKDAAKDLQRDNQSPEMKAALERFNQLIDDLAHQRLDRTEAFRKMEALERELLKGAEMEKKDLEDAMKKLADELKKSDLSQKVGESIEKKDLKQAQKELKALADQLRGKNGKKPDKAQLEKLKAALEKAAKDRKQNLANLNEKRAELREELLKKKKKPDPKNPDAGAKEDEEEKLLKKKERELERLDREAERQERIQRALEKLDRELGKAAADLFKELGLSAEDLESAAEDLNRLDREQMSDKEKEELRQRLQELKELLRQQGQAGKDRLKRMMKFGKKARGGSGGQPGQPGQKGDQDGGDEDGDGKDGDGKDGKDGKNGQGKDGQKWVMGPGGKKILVPGGSGDGGDMPGGGQSPGQGGDKPGGDGNGPPSGQKQAGSGHDPNLKGDRTDPKMGTQDVQAQGADTGQGPSPSQVILAAAERGFKGSPYKKVFTDYRTVAEQQINKDKIPDGYRFYVQRYFQLIRPRE